MQHWKRSESNTSDKEILKKKHNQTIQYTELSFSRPSPKAGRELQTVSNTKRMMNDGPLAKNQPEPVTGP